MKLNPILDHTHIDHEAAYYIGFAEALMYAQAAVEARMGNEAFHVEVAANQDLYAVPGEPRFDPRKLVRAADWIDEGGIYLFRFEVKDTGVGPYYRIHVWCSEGEQGMPDNPPYLSSEGAHYLATHGNERVITAATREEVND